MNKQEQIDWSQCPDTEVIPGKVGGVPLVKGTRIPAQQIMEELAYGSPLEEIVENYPSLTPERICRLLGYAAQHKSAPVP